MIPMPWMEMGLRDSLAGWLSLVCGSKGSPPPTMDGKARTSKRKDSRVWLRRQSPRPF